MTKKKSQPLTLHGYMKLMGVRIPPPKPKPKKGR